MGSCRTEAGPGGGSKPSPAFGRGEAKGLEYREGGAKGGAARDTVREKGPAVVGQALTPTGRASWAWKRQQWD